MRNVRFYLEYKDPAKKRKGTVANPGPHDGNVIALYLNEQTGRPLYHIEHYPDENIVVVDCAAAVQYHPNSPVATTSVSDEYLRKNCRRIPERLAREIHPELFKYLEQGEK